VAGIALTLFGYTFSHAQLEMIMAVFGSLFGLLVLWGVVTRTTRLIVIGLIMVGLIVAWWYGMNHSWFDGVLGPPA
jgi:hypothetical protein